jgi:hypothetical protein
MVRGARRRLRWVNRPSLPTLRASLPTGSCLSCPKGASRPVRVESWGMQSRPVSRTIRDRGLRDGEICLRRHGMRRGSFGDAPCTGPHRACRSATLPTATATATATATSASASASAELHPSPMDGRTPCRGVVPVTYGDVATLCRITCRRKRGRTPA